MHNAKKLKLLTQGSSHTAYIRKKTKLHYIIYNLYKTTIIKFTREDKLLQRLKTVGDFKMKNFKIFNILN